MDVPVAQERMERMEPLVGPDRTVDKAALDQMVSQVFAVFGNDCTLRV